MWARFRVNHPAGPGAYAWAGVDHVLGFFVEVRGLGKRKTYDAFDLGYNRERPLWGALTFLLSQGFYTRQDLESALCRHQNGEPRLPELGSGEDIAMEFIVKFKGAADEG